MKGCKLMFLAAEKAFSATEPETEQWILKKPPVYRGLLMNSDSVVFWFLPDSGYFGYQVF